MEISDKELADHLPNILDFVFQGGSVKVTHQGVAKIQIKPFTNEDRLAELVSSGRVRLPTRPGRPFQEPPIKLPPGTKSPLQELLEERHGDDED